MPFTADARKASFNTIIGEEVQGLLISMLGSRYSQLDSDLRARFAEHESCPGEISIPYSVAWTIDRRLHSALVSIEQEFDGLLDGPRKFRAVSRLLRYHIDLICSIYRV